LYLKNDLRISIHQISFLFSLSAILIVLLQMPLTSALSQINAKINSAFGTIFICLGFAVLPLLHGIYVFIVASCLLWTIGEMIFFPATLKLMILLSGKKKGKIMGTYQLLLSLSALIAPLVGATLYSWSKDLIWYVCGVVGLVSSMAFLIIKTNHS
jgi:MFS family permease